DPSRGVSRRAGGQEEGQERGRTSKQANEYHDSRPFQVAGEPEALSRAEPAQFAESRPEPGGVGPAGRHVCGDLSQGDSPAADERRNSDGWSTGAQRGPDATDRPPPRGTSDFPCVRPPGNRVGVTTLRVWPSPGRRSGRTARGSG